MLVPPEPGRDEVHLWKFDLEPPEERFQRLSKFLNVGERSRASRFRFRRDRRRFVAARGALRVLLARSIGMVPEEVEFAYGPSGKPRLAQKRDLRFNLAHSDRLGVVALSRGREVGVDVERVRTGFEGEEIAERFFASREIDEIVSRPESERNEAFFRCWTAKEAYVKAVGEGLGIELNRFAVSSGSVPAMVENDRPDEIARWSFRRFEPDVGYVGALAVEGGPPALVLRDFETIIEDAVLQDAVLEDS
jgi:4'-phosphopantetheinyl transferase